MTKEEQEFWDKCAIAAIKVILPRNHSFTKAAEECFEYSDIMLTERRRILQQLEKEVD